LRLLDAVGGQGFADDPAGPYEDGLPDEIRLKMKRIPTVVAILRQLDRVSYLLSTDAGAASAVQALYALTSPYLKRLDGWAARWDARPCAGVRIGDRWVPTPQPADYGAWLELIMDGLADAGVIFEQTHLSFVGPVKRLGPREPPKPKTVEARPEPLLVTPRVGSDIGPGTGPPGVVAASGFDGLGFGVGPRDGSRTLGVRVQPGRRVKRSVPVDPGAPGLPVAAPGSPVGGFGARVATARALSAPASP